MIFRYIAIFAVLVLFMLSCKREYTPKPRGYFRIDLPKKKKTTTYSEKTYPYQFEVPDYYKVEEDKGYNAEPYWINVVLPQHEATIHISYKNVGNNIDQLIKDAHTFVYKHAIKADAIAERPFVAEQKSVYGMLYEIEGNAASSLQFYLTDSTKNFMRGALYFNSHPNKDSIQPVLKFIRKDLVQMMETLEWKNKP